MSIDTRIGIAGLIVALFSIAAFYLWPDKKWIGWLCFSVGVILLTGWIVFELKQRLGNTWISLATAVLIGAVFGGAAAALIWRSVRSSPMQEDTAQESTSSLPSAKTSDSASASPALTKTDKVQPRAETSSKREARSPSAQDLNQPSAINQTMTNSPGGIQAGRDVTVGREPPPALSSPSVAKDRKKQP